MFLYFRVGFRAGSDVPKPETLRARLTSGWSSTLGASFLGTKELASDYSIAFPAHILPELHRIVVRISCDGQELANEVLDWVTLLEPPGPEIEIDRHRVKCHVMDEKDVSVQGASIRAAPSGASDSHKVVSAVTPEDGVAELWLPSGGAELCIGANGFMALILQVATPTQVVVARLQPQKPSDTISIWVMDADGRGVPEALVTVTPNVRQEEQSFASFVQGRTNEQGWVVLPRNVDGAATVRAFHSAYGTSPTVPFASETSAEIRLYLESVGTLQLALCDSTGVLTSLAGPGYWAIVEKSKVREWSGLLTGPDMIIDQIPVGQHVVGVYIPSAGLIGFSSVQCRSEALQAVTVSLTPVTYAEGRVHAPPGENARGLEVIVRSTGIPDQIAARWCRSAVSSDGQFRVMCAVTEQASFSIHRGDTILASTEMRRTLQPVHITLGELNAK